MMGAQVHYDWVERHIDDSRDWLLMAADLIALEAAEVAIARYSQSGIGAVLDVHTTLRNACVQ